MAPEDVAFKRIPEKEKERGQRRSAVTSLLVLIAVGAGEPG